LWSGDYRYIAEVGVSSGLKQFVIAVDIYAATNPLRPWTAFQ